jgi:hypothetical protein
MAITSVGTPANTHSATGSVTSTWGAGQTRTAGNLLVAVVSAGASTSVTTTATVTAGWVQQFEALNSATANVRAAVWTKVATGADAVPVFTSTETGTAGGMDCMLFEFAGADLYLPVDAVTGFNSGASPLTLSAMTVTTVGWPSQAGEYAIAVFAQEAAAGILTWTDTGTSGFTKLLDGNGASTVLQTYVGVLAAPAAVTPVNDAGHFSTNTSAFGAAFVVVFGVPLMSLGTNQEIFANNPAGTVTAGGTGAPAAGTAESWTVNVTAAFPATALGVSQFHACDPAAPSEQFLVNTAPSGTGSKTWSVIRGTEGTTPVTHSAGFTVQHVVSAGNVSQFSASARLLQPWNFLPNNWYSGAWFTAENAGFPSPTWILFDGDSIMEGVNAVNAGYIANGWPDKLREMILTTANTPVLYGDFYPFWAYTPGSGGLDFLYEGFGAVLGGSAEYEGGFGTLLTPGTITNWFQTVSTGQIPGWSKGLVTGFDIVYYDYGVCTWGFDIDGGQGGTPTVVGAVWNGTTMYANTTVGGGPGSGQVKKVTVRGLTAGTHVIRYGQVSATGSMMPIGMSLFTGATTGVGFVRNCYAARRMVDAATPAGVGIGYANQASAFPADRISLWSGAGQTTGTVQITPVPFGFPTQPSLAFIGWGINDAATWINPQSFADALERRIIAIRRGVPNANIVIVAHAYPDNRNSDNNLAGNGGHWGRYKAVMAALAASYSCAYVDIDSRWYGNPVAQGFMVSGDVHPTNAGNLNIAQIISEMI